MEQQPVSRPAELPPCPPLADAVTLAGLGGPVPGGGSPDAPVPPWQVAS